MLIWPEPSPHSPEVAPGCKERDNSETAPCRLLHFHEGFRCGSSPGSNYNSQTPPTPGSSQFGENPFLLPRSPFQRSLSISDCPLPSIYNGGRPPPMPMLTHLQTDIFGASSIHGLNLKQVFGPLQHHVWLKSSSGADQNSETSRSFDAQFLVSGARSVASSVSVPPNVRSIRRGNIIITISINICLLSKEDHGKTMGGRQSLWHQNRIMA